MFTVEVKGNIHLAEIDQRVSDGGRCLDELAVRASGSGQAHQHRREGK